MTSPTFQDADIPADATPIYDGADGLSDAPQDAPPSDDLTCEVCGVPLSYGGRGRKPKRCAEHKAGRATTAAPRARAKGDVEAALARMEMLYSMLATGLFMVSPAAASEFAAGVERTQVMNRQAFEADARLTKRINATSQNAGGLIFFGANAMLIGPAVRVVLTDLASKRAEEIVADDAAVTPLFPGFPDGG